MSEEILINITPMESRVAVVENGVLQEVHVERTQRRVHQVQQVLALCCRGVHAALPMRSKIFCSFSCRVCAVKGLMM